MKEVKFIKEVFWIQNDDAEYTKNNEGRTSGESSTGEESTTKGACSKGTEREEFGEDEEQYDADDVLFYSGFAMLHTKRTYVRHQ